MLVLDSLRQILESLVSLCGYASTLEAPITRLTLCPVLVENTHQSLGSWALMAMRIRCVLRRKMIRVNGALEACQRHVMRARQRYVVRSRAHKGFNIIGGGAKLCEEPFKLRPAELRKRLVIPTSHRFIKGFLKGGT